MAGSRAVSGREWSDPGGSGLKRYLMRRGSAWPEPKTGGHYEGPPRRRVHGQFQTATMASISTSAPRAASGLDGHARRLVAEELAVHLIHAREVAHVR